MVAIGSRECQAVPCDSLSLGKIRKAGTSAVVEFSVGERSFVAEIPPTALQSFARFQAAAFASVGVWPRDWEAEFARDKAQVWAEWVAAAMKRGAAE